MRTSRKIITPTLSVKYNFISAAAELKKESRKSTDINMLCSSDHFLIPRVAPTVSHSKYIYVACRNIYSDVTFSQASVSAS